MTTWVWIAAAALLGGVLLWGLVAPRTQWRVLVGWSARDPDAAEPGTSVHGVRRLICGLGLLALLAVGAVQVWNWYAARPLPAVPPTPVEEMWGDPVPRLVDRLIVPGGPIPEGLVASSVLGYQELDRGYPPNYLVEIPRWTLLGQQLPVGLLGTSAGDEYAAYVISDILLEVQGPLLCVPRAAAVIESETEIQVGVYWGLPGVQEQDHVAGCADAGVTQRVLIPVRLSAPLEGRRIVTIEGAPVGEVLLEGE